MSQPSKELLSPAEVWKAFHDHPTFSEFLKIHDVESPRRADETKDQYNLRVAQNFYDSILQQLLDEINKIGNEYKGWRCWIRYLPKNIVIDSSNKNFKDLALYHNLMSIYINLNCPRCGFIYGHADKIKSKDGIKYYNLFMRQRTVTLSNEDISNIAAKLSVTPDALPREATRREMWYQMCSSCHLPEKIPSILSKQNVGVPSDVPTTPPQAVNSVPPNHSPRQGFPLGVPSDVANIESVDWVKFLLLCLKPGSVLSFRQIHEILNIYARITIERALYRSEKEEVYQARGLKEHLMKTGWPRMYCLKPDSYAAFRQQYDIRQIRKIVDRFIGPSRYKNEFIELE